MKTPEPYQPDLRLAEAYDEATQLDEKGLEGLCPSYTELTATDTRYRDTVLLGKGAVKEVYKTFNNYTKRWIAMARLRADRGPEFYDPFVHEAWLTASLIHANIITIHDVGIDRDGRPFFTMDLKGKTNLGDLATGESKAGRSELLAVFMKVCDAVAYAHSRGVIHLDLKPANIQADSFGEVLVCDWGLAKLVGATEEGEDEMPVILRPLDNMTLMGQIKGSLGFMAPEQVIPGAVKDHRSDIFALGCVLHLILTGHPPFTGSEEQILEATKRGKMAPPRQRYPECHIPDALEAVVLKATAPAPDDRYHSVLMLRNEISNYLGGYSTLAEQPGFLRETRLFVARNRVPAILGFLFTVLLSVVSVLFVQHLHRLQQDTAAERARAVEFESKAETATILYQDELERSEQERVRLARELARSASDLKVLAIFLRPVETVREAHKLVASAFALDSDCATATLQRFSLECITLNFKDALAHPVPPQSDIADYLLFAKAFPSFNFSEEERPSIDQLAGFLQQAREIKSNRQAFIERVVAYDHAARGDKEGYAPVVVGLLEYVNGAGTFVLRQEKESHSLIVSSEQEIRLRVRDPWASKESLLRFLPFRNLELRIGGHFNLADLNGLPIETLDLRGCNDTVIFRLVSLPRLRKLTIRAGQIDPARLREFIDANHRFEIIVDGTET